MKTIALRTTGNKGKLKPINGVCNGPISHYCTVDLSEYYEQLHIPFVRLHDTEGALARYYVDISRIFVNFDADENEPSNYHFSHTDQLLCAIDKVGAKTIYRLGESIDHSIEKVYARPPKDFEKWTTICINIIKHYNEGWANGFHLGIEYFEIWNEPDLTDAMWFGGTKEQAFALYQTAAVRIKATYPAIKIGGMAFMSVDDYTLDFIEFCAQNQLPLDFIAYHAYYSDIGYLDYATVKCDEALQKFGFYHTEKILDEWNFVGSDVPLNDNIWTVIRSVKRAKEAKVVYDNQRNNVGASFVCASFIKMNHLPLDVAAYYDAQPESKFCGIFDRYCIPQQTFYAFQSYGEMRNSDGVICDYNFDIDGIYAMSVKTERELFVLVSNYRGCSDTYELVLDNLPEKQKKAEIYLLDKDTEYSLCKTEYYNGNKIRQNLFLDQYSMAYIKIEL